MSDVQGPYMNEDGDWWVPVEGTPFREARAAVIACMDAPRLAYLGKVTERITEHEYGCNCEPSCYREVLCYHFEERGHDD